MLLGYSTADEIVSSGADTAVIAVGSIEQHGPHLPVTTDWEIAGAVGRAVAEKAGAFYIPAFPVSTNREHMGKPGSVWMSPMTLYQMLWDVCQSLKEQGFKKIALIQAHGGIFITTPLVRELNATGAPDLMVAKLDLLDFWDILYSRGITETRTELHAGEAETSLMLYLNPDLVHMDRAVDFVPSGVQRSDLNYGSILRYCPDGVWGEARCASAEKGKKILECFIEESLKKMDDIFSLMEKKEKLGYSCF